MEGVLEFVWQVPEGGFRVLKTKPADGSGPTTDYLTAGQPLGVSAMYRQYRPLKAYTGLFRTFAEVTLTQEGVLAFANTYGSLDDGEKAIELPEGKTKGTGEPLSLWLKEISAMRRALELWDAVKAGNLDVLSRRIAWKNGGVMYDEAVGAPIDSAHLRAMQWIAAPEIHPERLERFRPGDLVSPALYVVQEIVNDHLHGRVSPRLLWGEDRSRLGLYLVPGSLIGALWLQFAQAIDRRAEFRRCEECRAWFEVSSEGFRTSKLYCSNACRLRAYRKRQAEARRLYAEGNKLEDIALALGSDVATVKGWIGKGNDMAKYQQKRPGPLRRESRACPKTGTRT